MITAGIDMGAKNIKVVLVEDGKVKGKALVSAGLDAKVALETAYGAALKDAKVTKADIKHITATGSGREFVDFANDSVSDVTSAARGAVHLYPSARTVVDVGAEEGRGIRCDKNGKVMDFAVNEKCAAGAGAFTEAMARALEVKLEELGPLSLKSTKAVPMNAQCAVFAESEVVSLVHAKTPKADISKAIHDAIADRIISMVRKVGFEDDIVLIGGVAKNVGFVAAMKRDLNKDIKIPTDPEFVSAMGAALEAADKAKAGGK
jgi:benzoyl-CoA reductase subunit D